MDALVIDGKCAQPCRLPYTLVEENNESIVTNKGTNINTNINTVTNTDINAVTDNVTNKVVDKIIDKGYLLSTKDLCSLDYITRLVKSGVKCFKIEGRMKPPKYVATVTRIYRKYIDLVKQNLTFNIEKQDKKDLMQVFNRGNFSLRTFII